MAGGSCAGFAAAVLALAGCAGRAATDRPRPADACAADVLATATLVSDAPAPPPPAAPPAEAQPAGPPAPSPTTFDVDAWWARALALDRPTMPCWPRAPVPCWSGDVTLRARLRTTDDEHDVDLYQTLRVRYRREDAPGWSGFAHVRVSEDVDGRQGDGASVFDSIDDTYDEAVLARVYALYGTWFDPGATVERVRVGRQDVAAAGEAFHVDGGHVLLRPCAGDTRVFAFGGVPTHLYDTGHEGDWIVGAGATFVPWAGATMEIADVWVEDHSGVYGREEANLAAVELSQRFGCGGARVGYQQIDDDPRRAWASADVSLPSLDAVVRGAVRAQLLSEGEQPYDLDPYVAILLDVEPYWDARVAVSKGLGCDAWLDVGAHVRRLFDADDSGTFNHDFTRVHATASLRDRPVRGLALAATGEWWTSEDGEDVGAVGFEAAWKPSPRWSVVAGVDYALYRADFLAGTERYDSYGAFARARWRTSPCTEWSASARVDLDDFDEAWAFELSVRFEF